MDLICRCRKGRSTRTVPRHRSPSIEERGIRTVPLVRMMHRYRNFDGLSIGRHAKALVSFG